ncbi:g5643 [Coccomyxa elongata]
MLYIIGPAGLRAQQVPQELQEPGILPEQGSPALASIMAQVHDADDGTKEILGEKGTYAIDASGQTGEVIYVNDTLNLEEAEGARLTEDLIVGKQIAGGAQGAIYELKAPGGKECGKLLKVLKFKAILPITGNDIGLKREWIIGQHLNKLRGPRGELAGFMGTGAALIRRNDQGLEGLILEKVNGMPLEKRLLKDETFADADYTLEMMYQVFSALDRGNRELGYVHRDMRISNIMEHRPNANLVLPKGFNKGKAKAFKLPGDKRPAELRFAIIDNGHARLLGTKVPGKLPEVPMLERMYRRWFSGKSDVWRLCQDVADCMDGRTWPAKDRQKVEAIVGLVKDVTGAHLYTFFEDHHKKIRRGIGGRVYGFFTMWQHNGKPGHIFRRYYIRMRVWMFPRKTRYTAAEALDYLRQRKVVPQGPPEAERMTSADSA